MLESTHPKSVIVKYDLFDLLKFAALIPPGMFLYLGEIVKNSISFYIQEQQTVI